MKIIDIIVIDLLTDIPRQVASECHWPAAQSRMFASAWQHLCCEAGYASSEFLRPFESPWVCGDGGGSRPWKCVLGHGAMCGPPKHGWDSGLVLIAVFEAQFFLGARTEVHATSSNMPPSEVRTKELYMIDTRDQLKVIENVANYHWWCFVFSVPLACQTVRGTCHPQRLGIIVDLYLAVLIAEKVTICLIDRWKCHNLGFWIVSGQHPMVASIQILITKV